MQLCSSLSIIWCCLSLQLEWKLTFSSPVATAEFSKFAGILSAALSQHHLSGFDTAQLEFHHLGLALFIVMLSKAHLSSHSKMSGSRLVITSSWLSGLWRSLFGQILRKVQSSKTDQKEIEIMDNPITSTKSEAVIKISPKKQKSRTRWFHGRILSKI